MAVDRGLPPRGSRGPGALRADLIALAAIAFVVVASHLSLLRRGLDLGDPSWCFHFARRTIHGAAPYRDYVYQAGPLPIYVDGLFQRVFGSSYTASLDAAMAITTLRAFATWLVVRRTAGYAAAAFLVVWCAVDPIFAVAYDASAAYAQLFIVLAGLGLLLAAQHSSSPVSGPNGDAPNGTPGARPQAGSVNDRRARTYLVLGGISAGLVLASRQGAGVAIAVTALGATAMLHARREDVTRPRLVALCGGIAVGLVLVLGLLATTGALGPALRQMFVDAPARTGLGVGAVFDAISGGSLVALYRTWWGGLLSYVGLSIAVVGTVARLGARDREVPSSLVAMIAMVALILLGLYLRYALLDWFTDLPRMFLTLTTVLAVGSPARLRRWFGVEPLVAIGLGALPLASDWTLQASLPGRDAGDAASLVTGLLLVTLASRHLASRAKTLVCGALALAAMLHFGAALQARHNPFSDGILREDRFPTSNPAMRDMRLSEATQKVMEWLISQVEPDHTCFIYGNLPVLYDVLGCHNPTRLDAIAVDSLTAADAEEAMAALRLHPPDYVIAHDLTAMLPALTTALDDRLESYGTFNPEPIRVLHMGLRARLEQYEPVGVSGAILGATLAARAATRHDHVEAIRLYRRKR